ncbi:MAG: iron chelate uptake ABC transporter family permease subunit [Bacteroidota bacterium]
MAELLTDLQSIWAIKAIVASSLVGITCGILGCFIVLRNMALIGDALSHSILLGFVIAFVLAGHDKIGFFVGSVLSGVFAAIGITWIQRNVKTKNDAAIGIVFTTMFSLGVIGISWISREQGVHLDLKDFLFGTTLGIDNIDIYLTAGTTVYVLISIVVFFRYLFVTTFQPVIAETMGISVSTIHYFIMLLLSFTVVASVQTVGLIQVVAMLITPASTALLLSDQLNRVLIISAVVGLLSAILGMILAIAIDAPPGPVMAVTAFLIYMLTALFAPKNGLVFRRIRKNRLQRKIQLEDILKQALRLEEKQSLSLERLQKRLVLGKNTLQNRLNLLEQQGRIAQTKNALSLTEVGRKEAYRLVRAHRLWETFLVDKMGLTEEQIHEDAEKYEHLLTEEILDEVDRSLGFPTTDPHGSPIPGKKKSAMHSTAHQQRLRNKEKSSTLLKQKVKRLSQLKVEQQAIIAEQQPAQRIRAQLWDLGLLPKIAFSVEKIDPQHIAIRLDDNQRLLNIPTQMAKSIRIE